MKNFQGGQLSKYVAQWGKSTSDKSILSIIEGDSIEFEFSPPVQHYAKNAQFSPDEENFIDSEIEKLLNKGVIKHTFHENNEFVSPIFITPKSDGTNRLILNLKKFNESVKYEHFKMSTIHSVLNMITKGCFMTKIDLKDAYYSVRINEKFQKYLKFSYKGKLFQFVCFPNGLAPCPRKFTKITKVPTSNLRLKGIPICGYIDDFFSKSATFDQCYHNTLNIIHEFQNLGFVIHPDKSQFEPTQEIIFLGFVINSVHMTVRLTIAKERSLRKLVDQLLTISKPTIRFVAKVVGTLVAAFPAVKFAPLHYRFIEKVKTDALVLNNGNFEASCCLSEPAMSDLIWWKNAQYENWIHPPKISLELRCDASTGGKNSSGAWGAVCQGVKTGGAWNLQEQGYHINVRELIAIYFTIRSFLQCCEGKHVLVFSDSTSAIGIVNKMGTSKNLLCNDLAKNLWHFCEMHSIWLTATYIPGVENVDADTESRKEYKEAEWKLNPNLFLSCKNELKFTPNIDCFASRINTQLPIYVSYRPDPFARHVNAFTLNWHDFRCYIFPPFSLIGRVLQKVRIDQAEVMMVAPHWPSQPWFTTFMEMLVKGPIFLSPHQDLLKLPQSPGSVHPLAGHLSLMVGILSGKNT